MTEKSDDGSAEWAAEQAVSFIARAWYRRTHTEHANGGELVLRLADECRSHITPAQWKAMELKNDS